MENEKKDAWRNKSEASVRVAWQGNTYDIPRWVRDGDGATWNLVSYRDNEVVFEQETTKKRNVTSYEPYRL